MTMQQRFRDAIERAGVTFVQSGGVMLIFMFGVQNTSFKHTAAVVGLHTVITFLLAFVPATGATFATDLAVRVVRTIITTVAALAFAVGFDLFDWTAWRGVWISVGMAVAVLIKGEIVKAYAKPEPARLTPASLASAAPAA